MHGVGTGLWSRSFAYMLIVGGVHYIALPALILVWEHRQFRVAYRGLLAVIAGGSSVLIGAILALVSGHFLVTRGHGTPFPLDPTRRLVTVGPYRYVRNPQAIAATLIVVGEVLALRSRRLWIIVPMTVFYLEGLAKPLEDRHMRKRFGDEYAHYKRSVPRWIPHRGFRDRK